MMRKPNKSSLAIGLDAISEKTKEEGNISYTGSDNQSSDKGNSFTDSDSEDSDDADFENVDGFNEGNVQRYVIDGGYLLHRVAGDKQTSYRKIIKKYISYVESHNGKSSIVFDEYQDDPSTKSHEHTRRTMKSKKSLDIAIHLENSIDDISIDIFADVSI